MNRTEIIKASLAVDLEAELEPDREKRDVLVRKAHDLRQQLRKPGTPDWLDELESACQIHDHGCG